MKMKKLITLGLATVMTLSATSVLASCNPDETMVWYSDTYVSINADSLVTKAVKQKSGLDFAFDSSVGSSTDKLSLMISSSEMPDILTMKTSDTRFRQLAQQGYLWSLDELCEQYNVEIDIPLDMKQIYAYNGKMYGLPNYYYLSDQNQTLDTNGGMLVRKDYFEAYMEYVIDNNLTEVDANNNGIADYDITSVEGATYAMRWVYHNCVPENKKSSYYGMLLDPFIPSTSYQGVAWMCQYFGVRFEDAQGNYVDGAETEQFKQVLKFLNALNNNDTINPGEPKMLPDAALSNTNQSQVGEVIARGDAFMFCGTPQDYPSYLVAARYPSNQEDEPVEYVSMVIKNDQREDPWLGDIAGSGYLITCIPKQCKDPEAAIKALAYLWSDEGQELCGYGIKGEVDADGNVTSVSDPDLAGIVTTDDVTYYVDENGQYHYTQMYLDVLAEGNEVRSEELGVGQWTLLHRPTYMSSRNWGRKTTNKESAYVNNIKKPLSMYSASHKACSGLLDPTYDYKTAIGKDYSEIVAIRTKVNSRWANMVSQIIMADNWTAAQSALTNGLNNLKGLGHTTLYQAYNIRYKQRKQELGIQYGYALNDPNYQKKTISEGGRYTWTNNGKTYTDIWGARGDINYYYDYIIV